MNIKKLIKIVLSIVITFCLVITLVGVGVFLVNPSFFSNNPFLGAVLPPGFDKPVNVLLLGLDKVSMNTDVIIVAHFDPKNKKASLLSIPRDTKVKYDGKTCKLNSIFARGRNNTHDEKQKDLAGLNLSKEIVAGIIGQNIDYAAVTNTEGFRNIIDILDGVEVNVPRNMDYDDYDQGLHIHLKKGLQVLDGKKAEQFVRYRHGYVEGDLGRIDAQKIFFKAFMEQKLKPKYILKADKLLAQVFNHVKTDMTLGDAIKYSVYAKDFTAEDIRILTLPGEAEKSSAWYFIYDPVETQKLITENFNFDVAVQSNNVNK